jgi:hypothetical protein
MLDELAIDEWQRQCEAWIAARTQPCDLLTASQLFKDAYELMRRAAAQAPSSGNDKLRRLRDILACQSGPAWSGDYQEAIKWAMSQVDRVAAEPSEPATADGELIEAAEWALRVIRDKHCVAKVPDPDRPDEPNHVAEALERAVAQARQEKAR